MKKPAPRQSPSKFGVNDNKAQHDDLAAFIAGRPVENGALPFMFLTKELFYSGEDTGALLKKAESGDGLALEQLVSYTLRLCDAIELLAKKNPELVKGVASTFTSWPVALSLSQLAEARRYLEDLSVGGDLAFMPSYPGKKTDLSNLWVKYATNVLLVLKANQWAMPERIAKYKQAKSKGRWVLKQFKAVHGATYYDVDSKVVVVADWQRACRFLPDKLTKDNVPQFMALAKLAIREFWLEHPEEFARVKTNTQKWVRYNRDAEYISRALDKIEQAMIGLAHK